MTINLTKHFQANATFTFSARWTSAAGIPFLLDDGELAVKEHPDMPNKLVVANLENGFIDFEPVDENDEVDMGGWCNVIIPHTTMDDLDYFGGGFWDIVVRRSIDGEWKRLAQGPAVLSKGVADAG